jgi:hypothetical protein
MIIEMVFNNENQVFFFPNQFIFLKNKIKNVYYQKNFKIEFLSCPLNKILIKYQISTMMFCVMF